MRRRDIPRRIAAPGFTVVELLVTAALVGILLSFTIRSLYEILIDSFYVKDTTVAAAQNLFFLETLARDARMRNRISEIGPTKVAFVNAEGGDTISWTIQGRSALREVGGGTTSLPIVTGGAVLAWKDDPPGCRYLCVTGQFRGLGMIEQGMSLRLDP